jgi:hypothetical protein
MIHYVLLAIIIGISIGGLIIIYKDWFGKGCR